MSKNVSEPVDYIFQSVHTALLTRDFQYAEKLLNQTLRKRKNLTPEERKIAEELRARVYVRANNLEKALESCLGLYNENPDDIETMNTLGVLYRQLYRFDESLAILNKAKERDPENEGVFYNLGKTYQEMKQYPKAVECFLAALELKPEDVSAYDLLGGLYAQLYDNHKAINSYRQGLQWDPNNPSLNFHLAQTLQAEKRYEEAITYYKAALKTQPAWKEALQNIASLYVLLDKLDDALPAYKSLLRISGKNAAVCTEIGTVFERKQLPAEAEQYYREAVNTDSGYAPAVLALAALLKKAGHHEEALPVLLKAQSDPKNTKNYQLQFQTAEACIEARNYAAAKNILQNLESSAADTLTLLKLQGKLAALMGDTARAEKIFEKIIAMAPAEIEFRYELADHYVKTGKYTEAKEQLQLFLNGKPDDINARLLLGKTEELLNDPTSAYSIYQKIIQDSPDSIDARAALSQLLHKHGNTLEALQTADEMVRLQSNSTAEGDIQGLADSLELYEKAVENYIADPALTKNLEKLRLESDPEFLSSEELAEAAYQDELFPLFDEGTREAENDIPLELFTEDITSELIEESDDVIDTLLPEDDSETEDDSSTIKQAEEPAMVSSYDYRDTLQTGSEKAVLSDTRSLEEVPAALESLSAADTQEPVSSADEPISLFPNEASAGTDTMLHEAAAAESTDDIAAVETESLQSIVSTEESSAENDNIAAVKTTKEPVMPVVSSGIETDTPTEPVMKISPAELENGTAIVPMEEPVMPVVAAGNEIRPVVVPADSRETAAMGQPPAMQLYTPSYNTEMLDAAVQSLNSIVSHLNTSIEAVQKNNLADTIAEQVSSTILDKVHELSEARYKNADEAPIPAENQTETGSSTEQIAEIPVHNRAESADEPVVSLHADTQDNQHEAVNTLPQESTARSHHEAYPDTQDENLQENAPVNPLDTHCEACGNNTAADNGVYDTFHTMLPDNDEETMQWFRRPHTIKDSSELDAYLDTVETETLAGMLMYLKDLFSFLPSQTLGTFLTSRQRMQIQYIISRLSGELGLKDRAELMQKKHGYTPPKPHSIDRMQLMGLFEYLHDLCVELSDEGLRSGCMRLLDQLLSDIWQITTHENT